MPAAERSKLHVEGINDVHVVKHLLLRHRIDCPTTGDGRPQQDFAPNVPEITAAGDKDAVLAAIGTAVPVSIGRSVGFVLDADAAPQDRWRAVRDRFRMIGLDVPALIPGDGFVADVDDFRARVGVWLMPNNQHEGALEEFLEGLVDDRDPILPLAETSTEEALKKGARFSGAKHRKAVLHAWLAWQQEPGLPYGAAINARYFLDDSPAALAFVEWYRRVFP